VDKNRLAALLLPALFGLLGTTVGGFLTYKATNDSLSTQIRHEDARESDRVRGSARIYGELLKEDIVILETYAGSGYRPPTFVLKYFQLPPIEDRRLVQSRLSLKSALAVRNADGEVRVNATRIETEGGQRLNPRERELMRNAAKVILEGFEALAEVGR
jgi:hypothetical protein